MKLRDIMSLVLVLILASSLHTGCDSADYDNPVAVKREPVIEPLYSDVTIPPNIAPLNFIIKEKASAYLVVAAPSEGNQIKLKTHDGKVIFPLKAWKKMLQECAGGKISIKILARDSTGHISGFDPIRLNVAREPVDPYLCYRILYPGYRSWVEMKIVQRCLEDFTEQSLFENQLLDNSCVNCHSFNQNNPDKFMMHVRGSGGGTYFYDGRKLTRVNMRTREMKANAVYPAWHPSGKYIAFSSNKTVQSFHMRPEKNIEVYDLYSSLIIYNTERNEVFGVTSRDTVKWMETFPCWAPDGKYLYYCRAKQVTEGEDYTRVRYNLVRKSFDQNTETFGDAEIIFDAISKDKSVSLPVVSPDGKYLVFTLHDYGTFSIWHKEADLYLLDLQGGTARRMELNSEFTESWHSWSSNGRWLVFSSKRDDGLTARPYFSYFFSPDSTGRPFIMPQKDPLFYRLFEKTFNRPELVTGKVNLGPRDFEKAAGNDPVRPEWTEKGSEQSK